MKIFNKTFAILLMVVFILPFSGCTTKPLEAQNILTTAWNNTIINKGNVGYFMLITFYEDGKKYTYKERYSVYKNNLGEVEKAKAIQEKVYENNNSNDYTYYFNNNEITRETIYKDGSDNQVENYIASWEDYLKLTTPHPFMELNFDNIINYEYNNSVLLFVIVTDTINHTFSYAENIEQTITVFGEQFTIKDIKINVRTDGDDEDVKLEYIELNARMAITETEFKISYYLSNYENDDMDIPEKTSLPVV